LLIWLFYSICYLCFSSFYQIETLEEFEKVSTSEERQSFIEKLDQVNPFPWVTEKKCYLQEYWLKLFALSGARLVVYRW